MSEELGRRAVACARWRWMPGMLSLDTGLRLDEMTDCWEAELPDLTDPATLGCIEHGLLQEAWPGAFVMPYDKKPGWWVAIMPAGSWPDPGPTKAEALIAALEAAP